MTGLERRSVPPNERTAVVVGLCAHGLAVVRSLAARGVQVVALEENSALPGTATSAARVHFEGPINGPALVDTLLALAARLGESLPPVLLLTNDRMVRAVAEGWPKLAAAYDLSWAGCRDTVLELLDKRNLERHCAEAGIAYPRTVVFDGANFDDVAGTLARYPLMAKPAHPLGTFKAVVLPNQESLERLATEHARSLPFLIQQWIPGGDEALKVSAFVLRDGRVLAAWEGRKLRSQPPGRGQTSVMQTRPDPRVHAAGERFFAGLRLSGPVSVEFKEDRDGEFFVIEPTLGRTDYFIDACVANGANLPWVEYADVARVAGPAATPPAVPRIWFDTERDPGCLLRLLPHAARLGGPWIPIFPFLSAQDPRPFAKAVGRELRALPSRLRRKLARTLSSA